MTDQDYIHQTQVWIKEVVIGLNLCPFAGKPFREDKIRYVVEESSEIEDLWKLLVLELEYLVKVPDEEVETTLIIHPNLLVDFLHYNNFVSNTEMLLEEVALAGVIQIASFHPAYQFAGEAIDAVSNYTNRSPFPMLHLLREDSVELAVKQFENIEDVPYENIRKLNALGLEKMKAILRSIQ